MKSRLKMNGGEVASRIREHWPELRLVVATGYADTEAIGAIEGQGVLTLRKPFRIDELLRAISIATNGRSSEPSSVAAE